MATSLTTKFQLAIDLKFRNTVDLNTVRDDVLLSRGVSWAEGTGANQADQLFHDNRSLADGANETLDLYASGSLVDQFGAALTIEKLKLLYIKNNSADATLKIGGGASNDLDIFAATSDILLLPPGGEFLFTAPAAAGVDITTNKNLKLEHDGTGSSALLYDIIVIGVD